MYNILLVEDNSGQLFILQRELEQADRKIKIARSTAEAMSKLSEGNFDLVILDLRFKDGLQDNKEAGIEILHEIRQHDSTIQVMVVTNYPTPELSEKVMEMGAFDMLDRNPSGVSYPAMLRGKVRLALDYRRLLQLAGRQKKKK